MVIPNVTRVVLVGGVLAALVVLPTAHLTARDPVSGRVIDADTGQPVSGAVVTVGQLALSLASRPTAPLPPLVIGTSSGLTTSDGEFALPEVPPHYGFIGVTAAGYVPGAYGQRFVGDAPLAWDDQSTGPIVVRLAHAGTIAGALRDDQGDPIAGATVQSLRRMLVGGKFRYGLAARTHSDDRGLYRLTGLLPGQYLVATTDVAVASDPQPPVAGPPPYPTTFFPGRAFATDATPLSLAAGEVRANIDFVLTTTPCVPVIGVLPGAPPGLAVDLERVGAVGGPVDLPAWRASTDPAGRVAFPCVAAGQYHVTAAAPKVWFDEPLTVQADPITDWLVPARPLSAISGRLVAPDSLPKGIVSLSSVVVALADGRPGPVTGARAQFDGSFSVGLPPGTYVLSSTVGRQATSVRVGLRDSPDGRVVVGAADLPDVILAAGQGSDISGRVDLGGADWRQVSVYVFPQDRTLWTGYGPSSRCLAEMRLDHNRSYGAALPPGAYFVVAVTDGAERDWRDPAMLARLARLASAFELADGQSLEKDLPGLSAR